MAIMPIEIQSWEKESNGTNAANIKRKQQTSRPSFNKAETNTFALDFGDIKSSVWVSFMIL
ncbi:hypothetical protein GCM10011274_32410 [Paraglaciecola chathamensis]|uniref:Uncharacterized protein n=1 Tax=Paraglaciecola chathamensis TaxID=368405 RepID=A0A8H9M1Y0_9ALTE|nr:hypothetical protein GCM10011274_32410 [Paraglaciecola oceanifecundans]